MEPGTEQNLDRPERMNGSEVPEPEHGTEEGRCTVAAAARVLGITERAVRKRIAAGTLQGEREAGRWVVVLPGSSRNGPTEPRTGTIGPSAAPHRNGTGPGTDGDLVALVERQQERIMDLAGQLGYLQRLVQEKDEQTKLLEGPTQSPTVNNAPPPRPAGGWALFLWHLRYGWD